MIPIIDFSVYGLGKVPVNSKDLPSDDDLKDLSEAIFKAFSEVGFIYLNNHGVDQKQVERVLKSSKDFFMLPLDTKLAYAMNNETFAGYSRHESTDPGTPEDQKETFNLGFSEKDVWECKEIPDFKSEALKLYNTSDTIAQRIMEVIALGLNVERNFFAKYHKEHCDFKQLRTTYYPPIPDDFVQEAKQSRLGEHSDYGTITLLYQDNAGGLEVRMPNGQYYAVTPIPGTIVVNIADLLQQWTSDRLLSSRHRVSFPKTMEERRKDRQSLAFFYNPALEAEITCIDGTDKYPPITWADYGRRKMAGIGHGDYKS